MNDLTETICEKRYKVNSLKIMIILLCGIIAAMALSGMYISRSFNLDCFYDVGKVYDVQKAYRDEPGTGILFRNGDASLFINENHAVKTLALSGRMEAWKIAEIDLNHLSCESMEWTINYKDQEGNLRASNKAILKQGKNILDLPGENFSMFEIIMDNLKGVSFSIESIQFREEPLIISNKRILLTAGFFLLCYLIAVVIFTMIVRWRKKNGTVRIPDIYIIVDKLQDIYIKVSELFTGSFQKCSARSRSFLRRILFLGLLYYMLVINNKDTYFFPAYFPRHVAVWSIFLVLIAVLCIEKPVKKLDWNYSYTKTWIIFYVMICISDFIVKKRLTGWGYLMIFGAGFLFFVWGNMNNPEHLLTDMIRAIEWFSIINLVFCFLARPKIEGYSYCGIAWNPNIYAQYLIPMAVVFLAEIDNWLQKREKRGVWIFSALTVICYYLGWLSQSRSGVIGLGAVFAVFVLKELFVLKENRRWKRIWKAILITGLVFLPSVFLCRWCLEHIPQKLDTQIIFPRDDYKKEVKMPSLGMEVQAAAGVEILENRMVEKFLNIGDIESFTSSRSLYWRAYLRNMNLWGHKFQLEIWGKGRGEHNGFITIAYRYGVFTLVPYILMIGFSFKYAWLYMKQKERQGQFAFYPIGISAGMLCLLLVENVERPFYSVSCLSFYLLPGLFFIMQSLKYDDNKLVKSDE